MSVGAGCFHLGREERLARLQARLPLLSVLLKYFPVAVNFLRNEKTQVFKLEKSYLEIIPIECVDSV